MEGVHHFYTVSPWEMWKQGSQYFSDSLQEIDQKEILLCSGQDLGKALLFDEAAIRQTYSKVGEVNFVDGIF